MHTIGYKYLRVQFLQFLVGTNFSRFVVLNPDIYQVLLTLICIASSDEELDFSHLRRQIFSYIDLDWLTS